jgi:peptidoglycan lytic transglycosylase
LTSAKSASIARGLTAAIMVCALLSACSVTRQRSPTPGLPEPTMHPVPPPMTTRPPGAPPDVNSIPDAIPRDEPRSKRGNPPFYSVLGKRYVVLDSAEGYVEQGVASWYGPTFHGELTSNGESYDMYAMSAAHKTLPLPAYVRVTNLSNGRSVVVRINDRGPFAKNRIIDLSYTAAAKLDMLKEGTALVEVRVVTAGSDDRLRRTDESPPQTLYVQAGAFSDEANAARLVARLKTGGITNAFVQPPAPDAQPKMYRVRVGPVSSTAEFDRTAARLAKLGITEVRLATD